MRILCLDIGAKRIGIAVSDPVGLGAHPLEVIARRGGRRDFDRIAALCRDFEVQCIVVGLPLDAEGEEGPQAAKVRAFAGRLTLHLASSGSDLPLEFWDERYSTAVAEERLIALDASRSRRRKVIDKMAAVVILEEYLERLTE